MTPTPPDLALLIAVCLGVGAALGFVAGVVLT